MYIIKQLLKKIKGREKSNLTPKNESGMNGRSMTEMLGVLVVIGILSISVIVGYNYGMDKYRANTTINEINLRISDLIMQSNRGGEFNLAEWDTKSQFGYTFDNAVRTNVNGTFLKISGLPKRICEMVVDILGEKFDIEVNATRDSEDTALCGTDNEVSVFFELGLCADVTCGECEECYPDTGTCEPALNKCAFCRWTGWLDSGKPSFDKAGGDFEKIDDICKTGFVADIDCRAAVYPSVPRQEFGQAVFCDTTKGLICRNSDQVPGSPAIPMPYCLNYEINVYCCDSSNAIKCSCSECQICNDDGSCSTVRDGTSCPMGICMNGVCEPACRDEDCDEDEYCARQNNSCQSARSSVCKPLDFKTVTITLSDNTTETWYKSKTYMSWWDASAACRRLGKTMITIDELTNNWDGKTGQKTLSDRATKLKEAGVSDYIWTSNLYDSCNAFYFYIGIGRVFPAPRNQSFVFTLCH